MLTHINDFALDYNQSSTTLFSPKQVYIEHRWCHDILDIKLISFYLCSISVWTVLGQLLAGLVTTVQTLYLKKKVKTKSNRVITYTDVDIIQQL